MVKIEACEQLINKIAVLENEKYYRLHKYYDNCYALDLYPGAPRLEKDEKEVNEEVNKLDFQIEELTKILINLLTDYHKQIQDKMEEYKRKKERKKED